MSLAAKGINPIASFLLCLTLLSGCNSADGNHASPATPPNATFTITYTTSSFTGMFGNFTLTGKGVMRCNG